MFEGFFGRKKEKYNPDGPAISGAEKMAKIGVAHADEEGVVLFGENVRTAEDADSIQDVHTAEDADSIQDDFDKKDDISKKKIVKNDKDSGNYKVNNERNHPKIGERHSDWKEKGLFNESDMLIKEEIDEKILDANADHNLEDGDYDSDKEDRKEAA